MNGCICNVKEGEEKLISVGDWVNLFVENICGEYWISGVADGNAIMKINYCPICGRKLEEEIDI